MKNEKLRKKALKFICIILLDENNKNIDSIAFKFGILCLSIITNPMHGVFLRYIILAHVKKSKLIFFRQMRCQSNDDILFFSVVA